MTAWPEYAAPDEDEQSESLDGLEPPDLDEFDALGSWGEGLRSLLLDHDWNVYTYAGRPMVDVWDSLGRL